LVVGKATWIAADGLLTCM